ncbi:hypothetical protein ACO22_01148 [Paracoccidioides brasiliensis]|uniref:Uncharacterized protein n=1 Tax=Paracoccidioides brasiliensis TaxID=121759 RepID=A0A1D2JMD0_PARBR|nr:hypothetical protein ACO22_01148 [Paracoccidioides brasiliensis]
MEHWFRSNQTTSYGARPEQLDREIREDPSHHIVLSTQDDLPMALNFFLEAKSPDGSLAVATRQACYNGALGACGMHPLQSYQQHGRTFDNNAYTMSVIYRGGILKLYTILSASLGDQNRPRGFVTRLNAWGMTRNFGDLFDKEHRHTELLETAQTNIGLNVEKKYLGEIPKRRRSVPASPLVQPVMQPAKLVIRPTGFQTEAIPGAEGLHAGECHVRPCQTFVNAKTKGHSAGSQLYWAETARVASNDIRFFHGDDQNKVPTSRSVTSSQ